jgi:YD repeat-containing protein
MKTTFASILIAILFASGVSAATITYTYDAAGRVTRVDYGNGKGYVYTYDANGNLKSRTAFSAAPPSRRRTVRH